MDQIPPVTSGGHKRTPQPQRYERIVIALPREIVAAVRETVQSGEAPSISAYIASAVQEKVTRERLDEILDTIFGERPMTAEERHWADTALVHHPTTKD